MKRLALPIACCLAGCGAIPADPDGTLDRVRQNHVFRVGLIASGGTNTAMAEQRAFLAAVAARTGARPAAEIGAADALFARLEDGELDLVIGETAHGSPWDARVTILPPLAEDIRAGRAVPLVAAARHGENAWIALLHREARRVAGRP